MTWPGAAPLSPPYLPSASVTLDAASAHADLIISQDLKTVTLDQASQSGWTEPTDPERFHAFRCVLGLARLLLRLPGLGGGAPRARGRGLRGGRGLRASTTEGHAGVGALNRLLGAAHRRLRVPGAHQGRHPGGSLGLSQESGRPRESRIRGGSLLRRHYQQPHLHLPGLLSRTGLPLLPALVSRHTDHLESLELFLCLSLRLLPVPSSLWDMLQLAGPAGPGPLDVVSPGDSVRSAPSPSIHFANEDYLCIILWWPPGYIKWKKQGGEQCMPHATFYLRKGEM